MCSGLPPISELRNTPGCAQRTIEVWEIKWSWVGHMQGKHRTHCPISPAPCIVLILKALLHYTQVSKTYFVLNWRDPKSFSTILCHRKKNQNATFFSPFSAMPFLSLYVSGSFNIWLTSASLQNFFLWISSNHSPVTPWSHLMSLFVFWSLLKYNKNISTPFQFLHIQCILKWWVLAFPRDAPTITTCWGKSALDRISLYHWECILAIFFQMPHQLKIFASS